MTDSRPAPLRSVEYNSTIHYDASPNLENAFESILNEKGIQHVAEQGLILASRTMRFANFSDLQQFQGVIVDPLLHSHDSHLQRLDMSARTGWDTIVGPNGRELNRIYFQPVPLSAFALRSLYKTYRDSHPLEQFVDPQQPRERLQSGSLSKTIPSSFLKVGRDDGIELLNKRLRDANANGRKVMYAQNPRPYNRPIHR